MTGEVVDGELTTGAGDTVDQDVQVDVFVHESTIGIASHEESTTSPNKSSSPVANSCSIHVSWTIVPVISRRVHEAGTSTSPVSTKCVPRVSLAKDLRSDTSALAHIGFIRRYTKNATKRITRRKINLLINLIVVINKVKSKFTIYIRSNVAILLDSEVKNSYTKTQL